MNELNVKCYYCGEDLTVDGSLKTDVCPHCKKEILVTKASKYLKSLNETQGEINKAIASNYYQEVDVLLEKADFYIKNEEYDQAEKVLTSALEITTVDSRIYMGLVKVHTKNYTDLENKTHYKFLEKAIINANYKQKSEIRAEYYGYYKRASVSKEELNVIKTQEAIEKKKRAEELLKDGIPTHFKLEKSLKRKLFITPIFFILSAVFFVIYLLNNSEMKTVYLLIFAGVLVGGFIYAFNYINVNNKVNMYNAILDFYDVFDKAEFNLEDKINVLKGVIEFAVSYLNNVTIINLEKQFTAFVGALVETQNPNALNFINGYKVTKKHHKLYLNQENNYVYEEE